MSNEWKPIRVLVVDDHPVVRQGLRSLLTGHLDIEITGEAENGTEVIPYLAKHDVDVILLDIKMKGLNGIEVARRVRHSHPQTKIIILTTYNDENYLLQSLEGGVHGYLLKNTSHESLADSIRKVNKGERLLSPSLISTVVIHYQKLAHEQALREVGLTKNELAILDAIANGGSNKDISQQFYWSEATVKRKVQEILEKLGVSNRAQAIAEAIRRGWI